MSLTYEPTTLQPHPKSIHGSHAPPNSGRLHDSTPLPQQRIMLEGLEDSLEGGRGIDEPRSSTLQPELQSINGADSDEPSGVQHMRR